MATYKPVSDRARAIHGEDNVDLDLTAVQEADEVSAGHLEIVPRPYRVLVNNFADGKQGSTVDLALNVDNEAALLGGGILERAEKPAKKPTK